MLVITHLEKPLWPAVNMTKADYLQYLAAVAKYMIPHIKDRPMTLIRCPHGASGHSFFQKNTPNNAPNFVQTYADRSGERVINYMLVNDAASLLWAGNQNALEFHPWYAPWYEPDYPRQLAFDLDPSTEAFEPVREVALIIQKTLTEVGLQCYAKTSGKTGLQLYVPIEAKYRFIETRAVMQFLAQYLVQEHPARITTSRRIHERGDKVYLDYVQHAQHKTLIAPYSTRITDSATVSAPVTWQEVADGCMPGDFTLITMVMRLEQVGDLFSPVLTSFQSLDDILSFLQQHRRL